MTREDLGLILEALERQSRLLEQIAGALESSQWQCGCGHINGNNLAICASCGRTLARPW